MEAKTKNILIGAGAFATIAIIYNAHQRRRKDTPVYFRESLVGNYNARTIPPFGIYVKESEKDNKPLIEHEKVHWKQYQEKGLISFYAQYAEEMDQYGYDHMPMEIEARQNETPYCKRNYTECVRTGRAKTVFNPNFRRTTPSNSGQKPPKTIAI